MTPSEFFLMAGFLNVRAEDQKAAFEKAREESEDAAARRQGKEILRFKGPGLKPKKGAVKGKR